ncbi:uncharacterized protein BP5553_09806 [Venustampulla echinocandica]|uniref:Uncharacterized protein n=1 Tax=Venustampulla echinocandica TaxID=2656787 RepID=A0A370TAR8_9HELO|nr:uncharacterized protein BP5553_09806 [Venustampulla echinocandica]RDL31017.1 hypothetical protein BP5553_09806 [Venustampulla echinocandica]
MAHEQVWHEVQNGESYCVVSGQRVHRRTYGSHGSSAGGQAPCLCYPCNIGQRPPLVRADSYSPGSGHSEIYQQYTSGIPPVRFGDQVSEGSDLAESVVIHDPYREALNAARPSKPPKEPPSGSKMTQLNAEYKAVGERAKRAAAAKVAKPYIKKDKVLEMGQKHPRKYLGIPAATGEWHHILAGYAKEAQELFKLEKQKRIEMGETFVGYDTKLSGNGHRKRIERVGEKAKEFARKHERHLDPQGKPEPELQPGPSNGKGSSSQAAPLGQSSGIGFTDTGSSDKGKTSNCRY